MGIDQSLTSTGISLISDGELIHYKVVSSSKCRDKFARMTEVSDQIVDMLYSLTIDSFDMKVKAVGIEGLPFGNLQGNVTRDLAGLQAVIIADLIDTGFMLDEDLFIIPPTTAKKLAIGKGRATKDEMVEALPDDVRKIFTTFPKTKGRYDLTDSYFIAKAVEHKL